MSEYTDLLARVRGGAPVEPVAPAEPQESEEAQLLRQVRGQTKAVAQANVYDSSYGNPDEEAKKRRVSQLLQTELGDTTPAHLIDLNDADRRLKQAQAYKAEGKTAEFLANPDNARIAYDDAEHLSNIEKYIKDGLVSGRASKGTIGGPKYVAPELQEAEDKSGKWADLAIGSAKKGFWSTNVGIAGAAAAPFEVVTQGMQAVGMPEWMAKSELGTLFRTMAESAQASTKAVDMPTPEGNLEAGVSSGVQSLTQNVLTLPAGVATKSYQAFAGLMSAIAGGQSYMEATDAGKTPVQGVSLAVPDAVAEYVTEVYAGKALFEIPGVQAGVKSILKGAANFATKEIIGEEIATAWQDFNKWMVMNPEKTLEEYIAERPDAAIQTAIATIVGGGGQIALMTGVNSLLQRGQKAQEAQQFSETIEGLNQLAQASKVLERSQDTAQEFFQSVLEEQGSAAEVWISPTALFQSGLEERIAEAIPEIQQQIQEAKVGNVDIRIPVANLIARMAGPEVDTLAQLVSTEPGGFSQAEAAEYFKSGAAQELQDTVEQFLTQKNADDSFRKSQEAVKTQILDEMNTVGRFTPAKNEADATLISSYYAVRAAQAGVTPEQLYSRRKVRFGSEPIGQQQLAQVEFDYADDFLTAFDTVPTIDVQATQRTEQEIDDEQASFLSVFPKGSRYTRDTGLLKRVRKASDNAANELKGNPAATRVNAEPLGPFSEYETRAVVLPGDSFNPGGRIEIQVFGKEQVEQGLSDTPALTITVTDTGELSINGPEKSSKEFAEFQKRGWADDATGAGGIQQTGWTTLKNPENPGKPLPIKQLIPLLADVHARVKEWKMADYVGLHWSRATGALGGLFDQDQSAVYFQKVSPGNTPLKAVDTESDAFEKWAGTDREVIAPEEINDFDFSQQGPFVMRGFHGTTNTFDEFNAGVKGNIEGQFGAVNYFTSSEQDASDNYAGQGPDLTNRIENLKERLEQEFEQAVSDGVEADDLAVEINRKYEIDLQALDIPRVDNEMDGEIDFVALAEMVSSRALHGGEEIVMGVFIRTDKPFVVGDVNSPWLEFFDESKLEDQAIEQVADNNQVSVEDVKADFDTYSDDISDARYQIMDEQGNPVVDAVQTVASRYDFDPSDLLAELYDMAADGSVRHNRLEEFMRQSEALTYAERPDDGALVQSQMIGEIIQALGFDSIILKNANVRFKNMNMESGTAHIHVFDANNTNIKSATDNSGAYDRSDPNIYHQGQGNRGAFNPETLTIAALKGADLTTILHEGSHFFFENDIFLASELIGKPDLTAGEQQIVNDVSTLLTWSGIKGTPEEQLRQWFNMDFEERRSHHERTAESFEKYLFEGKAPSIELQPYFQKFRAWFVSVYKTLTEFLRKNPEAGKLNDEVRQVFDRMIATEEQIKLAESGRSMMPLFTDQKKSGMTPEMFAAYQKDAQAGTEEAVEQLQSQGLKDMQWLHNAHNRIVKKLQKESKARRAEIEIEARKEVMSQPIYQAWQFLTGKVQAEDKITPKEKIVSDPKNVTPEVDTMFQAIEKLGGIDRAQLISEWGLENEEKVRASTGLGGKRVVDRVGGMSIDNMGMRLAELGYLATDKNGRYDSQEFESKFFDGLGGTDHYSLSYDYDQTLSPTDRITNPSAIGAGRFDIQSVEGMGLPVEMVNHLKTLKMTAKVGIPAEMVADQFGFSSADELIRTLLAVDAPKDAINKLTDARMLAEHGTLATQEDIEREADKAIHNEARGKFIAAEANALAESIGKRKILIPAVKEYAAQIIGKLKVRDIRPSQYASAETRAAKNAQKASNAGDTRTAAAEKLNQVIGHYSTRAAYDALEDVETGRRYLKKFDKRSKTLDAEYQDQIEALLERFELRKISNKDVDRRISLAKWIEAQRENGTEPDIPPELESEAFRKSYKEMTVEEFRGLLDTVKQIEHLGRLKHKLLTAQDQREFAVIVDEVANSIIENGGEARPVELESPKGIKPWLDGFAAGHRKLASLVRQMDGLKDSGPLWKVLVRGMNEAGTNEAVMNEKATEELAKLYKPLLDMKGGLNGDKQFIPEIRDSLTRAGRLSVALNWGNQTNRQRIMEGDGWNEYQVNSILSRLTQAEWKFVNSMWAYIDTYWPQIEAKEKRVTGRAPEKVKAEPFQVTSEGETISLRGGYYPLKYDSNRADRAENMDAAEVAKQTMRGAFTHATTARGHVEQRLEDVGMPVRKSLDVITQHIAQVTHDLAWHEWMIDANRIIGNKKISGVIREYYGTEVLRTMKDALTGIATADVIPQTKVDAALMYLRANVSRSTMGFSLTTAFLQPFGLTQSMVRIGPQHVLRGIARWGGDVARFENSMTWIKEKSDFMRLRSKTFNRELHEINGRVSKGHSKARTIYDAGIFMLMQKMQLVADVPTWIGAYEKAVAEGRDESTAVALADQSVLDSQGGGQTKDMAEFQRKHPFLTMFYSYFNTTLNLAAESTSQTDFKNPLAVAGWASDMALLMVIPALAPAMILAFMRGEDCDDPEKCAKKMAQAQAGYLLNLMLGVREVSGPVSGFDYAGPPVGRVVSELNKTGKQVAQGEADEGLAMSSISLLGVTLGIPTTQILRSYKGWKAWEEGDAQASSVLLGPPQKD